MSFMAGFGSAFSDTFRDARQVAAQEKQDAFRLSYQDYMQRRQQYDEWKREDGKNVNTAKSYEKMYNLPEGSWGTIYDWVKQGQSSDQIQEWIQRGEFTAKQAATVPEAPNAQGIDAEMGQIGMGQPPQAMAQVPGPQYQGTGAPAKKGLFGGLLGQSKWNDPAEEGMSWEQKQSHRALNRVAGASGVDRSEVDRVMAGYQPPEMPDTGVEFSYTPPAPEDTITGDNEVFIEFKQAEYAMDPNDPASVRRYEHAKRSKEALEERKRLDAANEAAGKSGYLNGGTVILRDQAGQYVDTRQGRLDSSGQLVGLDGQPFVDEEGNELVPFQENEEELKGKQAILKEIGKPLSDINSSAQGAKAAVRTYATMNDIVEQNPRVLNKWTSFVWEKGDKYLRDMAAGADSLAAAANGTEEEFQSIDPADIAELETKTNELLKRADPNNLAQQKALFDSQRAIFAYRLGQALGQEGRSLQEAERKMFTEMASSGVTKERFTQGMADILVPIVKTVDSTGQSIIDSSNAHKLFKGTYDYSPKGLSYDPIQTDLESDPDLAEDWNRLASLDRSPQPTPGKAKEERKETGARVVPKGAIEKMKANMGNEKYKEIFILKYGQKAFDELSGEE